MTLNKTWEECLRMWKWIAKVHKDGNGDVERLKRKWLKEHGYKPSGIHEQCFFCNAARNNCPKCPGKQVSKSFDCTKRPTYKYDEKPKAFYRKLVELNKKRLAKK